MAIGVTGGLGTGKTFVASVFKAMGAKVLDADRIAHGSLKKGSRPYKRIVKSFGPDILNKRGMIDRKRLAALVFGDSKSLKRLEGIIHPEVIRHIRQKISGARPKDVIVIDAPLLIEAGLLNIVDKLVVVTSSRKNQIKRAIAKFRITEEECAKRIYSQMPLEKKARLADFVMNNDGPKEKTKRKVKKIWKDLVKR